MKSGRTVTADDALPIERWLKLKPDHGPGLVLYAGEEYRILSPGAAPFRCPCSLVELLLINARPPRLKTRDKPGRKILRAFPDPLFDELG